MFRRRFITIVIIAPAIVGCTSGYVVVLPDVSVPSDQLLGGTEPHPVSGYTDHGGKYRRFGGVVQAVPPDSLQFKRVSKGATFGAKRSGTIRLHLSDVASIKFTRSAPVPGINTETN